MDIYLMKRAFHSKKKAGTQIIPVGKIITLTISGTNPKWEKHIKTNNSPLSESIYSIRFVSLLELFKFFTKDYFKIKID